MLRPQTHHRLRSTGVRPAGHHLADAVAIATARRARDQVDSDVTSADVRRLSVHLFTVLVGTGIFNNATGGRTAAPHLLHGDVHCAWRESREFKKLENKTNLKRKKKHF